MAIELMLEVDRRFSRENVWRVLASFPGAELVEENAGLVGPLSPEGPYLYVQEQRAANAPLARGYSADWLVAARIVFRVFTSHHAANVAATQRFLERFAAQSPAFFVLSFQYDQLYAVRDEGGLRFFGTFAS